MYFNDCRIKFIATHYGLRHQLEKLREELEELDVAIEEHLEKPMARTRGEVIEEMTDCMILFDQIRHLMDASEKEIGLFKDFKVSRQMLRIHQENEYGKAA